jgi:outer membrane protein assembly factor BamD (BamD/ComL family)
MRLFLSLICFLSVLVPLPAAIVQINGKWSDDKYAPVVSVAEHYELGTKLLGEEKWERARDNFLVIAIHFPESPFYADSLFYSGVCHFHCKDYDLANEQFATYLNQGSSLQHFEKVFEYKYQIAEHYSNGARKHLFGIDGLPKLVSGKGSAIELYDEVISAMPSREIGMQALFGKGKLLFARREYRESIDTLTTLVRRFPKTSLAVESYLLISEVYLEQCELEPQNPDFVALAKVNLQRFRKSVPGDEKIALVEKNLQEMKEICANTLVAVAEFYQKKKKPKAAKVYYEEAFKRYPDTVSGKLSEVRLQSNLKSVPVVGTEATAQK